MVVAASLGELVGARVSSSPWSTTRLEMGAVRTDAATLGALAEGAGPLSALASASCWAHPHNELAKSSHAGRWKRSGTTAGVTPSAGKSTPKRRHTEPGRGMREVSAEEGAVRRLGFGGGVVDVFGVGGALRQFRQLAEVGTFAHPINLRHRIILTAITPLLFAAVRIKHAHHAHDVVARCPLLTPLLSA